MSSSNMSQNSLMPPATPKEVDVVAPKPKPRCALVAVDLQHYMLVDPDHKIPHATRVRLACEHLLSVARGVDEKPMIIFVQHIDDVLTRGSPNWRLIFSPHHVPSEVVVTKTKLNAFDGNWRLMEVLINAGVDKVYIFGVQSQFCVKETTLGALAEGFETVLLAGAHSTYNGKPKFALQVEREVEDYVSARGAKIMQWEDVLVRWRAKQQIF